MTRFHLLLVGVLALFLVPQTTQACGFDFVSACNTKLNVQKNGTTINFRVDNCSYLTTFNSYNFGTVETLVLSYGEMITWESCTNFINTGNIYYRIYEVGQTPGAFQAYPLTQLTTVTGGAYRTKTRKGFGSVDLTGSLPSGNYEFEIYFEGDVDTDNNGVNDDVITKNNSGLNYIASFTLQNNNSGAFGINFLNKVNVSCNGTSDGSVTAQAAGGTAPHTYLWSTGATSATLSNVPAGTYSVTATDATSTTGSSSVVITEPATITPNATATEESSASANDGTATANPGGGTPIYTYAWSNGGTTQTITNLDAGSYTVTVTDVNGCTASQTVAVGTNVGTYCNSKSNFPWNDWISNVTFNNINKSSGKSVYSNFTTEVTDVAKESSYNIALSTSFSWTTHDEYWRVWIDYNQDAVFQEPEEIVYSGILNAPPFGTSPATINGNITIPTTANTGLTRMRVSMKRGAYATACETLPFGEVEDYTVNITSAGGGNCTLSAAASNVVCNDNGTSTNPSDDTYTFDLTVSGNGTSSSWTGSINGQVESGSYGVALNFGPYPISGGNLSFTIEDSNDPTCNDNVTVTAPATCSNAQPCAITASVSNVVCNSNGTNSDPSDDTYTFDLAVTNTGIGSSWTSTINGQNESGSYGVTQNFGPYPVSGGDLTFTVVDASDLSCTDNATATAPATCSNGQTCSLSASITNNVCNDNGTNSDPSDDTFTFNIMVTGTGAGSGWNTTINGANVSGNYGVATLVGPYPISGGALNFTIEDNETPSCNMGQAVVPPPTCSNSGGTPTYCASQSAFPWHDWIKGIEVGTINAPTGKSTYTDNTAMSTNLAKEQAETITLTAGFSWFTYEEHWKVWIDYNQDGTFQEPDEVALYIVESMPPNGTLTSITTGDITVPSTALNGATRMRIAMKRNGEPTSCETLPQGEVEDYTVVITTSQNALGDERTDSNLDLTAYREMDVVNLFWYVQDLVNVDWLALEKSADGTTYETFTKLTTNDFTEVSDIFEDIDEQPLDGSNFYRLKVQNLDGTIRFSKVQQIDFHSIANFETFPNPVSDFLHIGLSSFLEKDVQVGIYNHLGQPIIRNYYPDLSEEILEFDVRQWQEGAYFVNISVEGKRAVTKQVIVLRGQ